MLHFVVLFFSFLSFSNLQYQQCSHLSGSGYNSEQIFGTTGVYESGNQIGGMYGSTSFLINSNEILVCYGQGYMFSSDQIWEYSIEKHYWRFLKGRKNYNTHNKYMTSSFDSLNSFSGTNEIGSRYATKGWMNNDILTFFGGEGYTSNPKDDEPLLSELWRYNLSSNEYSVINCNDCENIGLLNVSRYTQFNNEEFDSSTTPGARKWHEIIQLNDKEILMIGGTGYSKFRVGCSLSDWFIFSTELMQWKFGGGDIGDNKVIEPIYGITNVYHKNNTIGSKTGSSGLLINEEEVLIFGGLLTYRNSNTIFKYNITSNNWKYVSGQKESNDYYAKGCLRYYDSTNMIGGRHFHKIWKINENEILVFGGNGHVESSNVYSGSLNDEWVYNIDLNLWRFTGKEKTNSVNVFPNFDLDNKEYSEDTMIGGIHAFVGEYLTETKELIICNGYGKSMTGFSSYSDDCWRFYYGNICNLIEDTNPLVCLGRGKCSNYNDCSCNDGYFGSDCELTKCNGILSNETETVCSGKGLCFESQCLCYISSIYNNPDCTINEEKQKEDEDYQQFIDTLWIYILVPSIIISLVIVFFIVSLFFCWICCRQKKKLQKFDGIENLDIILEEAKIEQNTEGPKINIDKSLFEINYKDINLVSILGEGAQSVCYLCQWEGNYCAYKSFSRSRNSDIGDTEELFNEFEKEVKIFSSINHPSILRFYGACVNLPHVGILLQYCQFGDLNSFLSKYEIKNKKKYAIEEKIRILKEISSGMQYLHGLNVLHRDLKPENILIDDNEHSKIMDFGVSKLTSNEEKTMTKQIGTSYYMAPEVFVGNQKYAMKCDVYSFAILTLVVITENYFPYGTSFNGSNQDLLLRKISKNANFRPKIDVKAFGKYQSLIELIKRNWDSDPDRRNTFEEIVSILKKMEEKISKKVKNGENGEAENINWKDKFEKMNKENEKNEKELKKMRKLNRKLQEEILNLKNNT